MWTIDQGKVNLTCDDCGETLEVPLGAVTADWVQSARDSKWFIVQGQPVPWVGLCLCPECYSSIYQKMHSLVENISLLVNSGNEMTSDPIKYDLTTKVLNALGCDVRESCQ